MANIKSYQNRTDAVEVEVRQRIAQAEGEQPEEWLVERMSDDTLVEENGQWTLNGDEYDFWQTYEFWAD